MNRLGIHRLLLGCSVLVASGTASLALPGLRFEVSLPPGLATNALNGRLLVILSSTNRPEPRVSLIDADGTGPMAFGRDVRGFTPARPILVDGQATASLGASLAGLPAGRYFIQALMDVSTDLRAADAGGNFMSEVEELDYHPRTRLPVKLALTRRLFDERAWETEQVKLVQIPSRLLSEFHHRPMFLRAGVILPRTFASEPERRYPLWMHIGGFGTRYTRVSAMMAPHSAFEELWQAKDAPQMIYLLPDGAGPNGDPYQVNSANNGPYGDAITQELIPYLEQQFRGIGKPPARLLSGRSTGGWVALALQIFYPDFFGGVWASSPDPVDFRAFELLDIYADGNAFVNEHGEERPSARDEHGDVRLTMRREVQLENVRGHGGRWTRSGGQWGAWNAVFSPRDPDGFPVPLWDASGAIDRSIATQWEKYDLRLVLERNWETLAPKLRGKLRIWTGEADDYFLNNAVHLLEESLAGREPKDVAKFIYGPHEGHGWMSINTQQMMAEMEAAVQAARSNP